jgi:hypothetical protein
MVTPKIEVNKNKCKETNNTYPIFCLSQNKSYYYNHRQFKLFPTLLEKILIGSEIRGFP